MLTWNICTLDCPYLSCHYRLTSAFPLSLFYSVETWAPDSCFSSCPDLPSCWVEQLNWEGPLGSLTCPAHDLISTPATFFDVLILDLVISLGGLHFRVITSPRPTLQLVQHLTLQLQLNLLIWKQVSTSKPLSSFLPAACLCFRPLLSVVCMGGVFRLAFLFSHIYLGKPQPAQIVLTWTHSRFSPSDLNH